MIIKNYSSLVKNPQIKEALLILDSGIENVMPGNALKGSISFSSGCMTIKNRSYCLSEYENIYVIGFGKSASEMARHIESIMGSKIKGGIVISTKEAELKKIKQFIGTHPHPTKKNITATKKIVSLVKKASKKDLIISLISGGGSALLCWPKISLDEYNKKISEHFSSGIDISELNKIRKRYSNVKGGKLAEFTNAKIISIIFSDVIGDDKATIASGPTYGAKNTENIVILNNKRALYAMKERAIKLGLKPRILSSKVSGEAEKVSKKLLWSCIKDKVHNCFIFGGETTVKVKGKGKGGRCQQMALSLLPEISKEKKTVFAVCGTDGRDGPTDAAGVIIDSDYSRDILNKKIDYMGYLNNNDSYNFFKKNRGLIKTGLTGANVSDIGIIIKG